MTQVPGFYGKVPSQGDFVSRRVSRDFLFHWDGWLQNVMATSRAAMGEHWQDVYLTSPIWRFVLSAGVCGEAAHAGIMMPSVDRVGRYFPLTVASQLPARPYPLSMAYVCRDWFELVEEQLLSVLLDEAPTLDQFDHAVQGIAFPTNRGAPRSDDTPGQAYDGRGQQQSIQVDGISVGGASCHMLERSLLQSYSNYSVWWTEGSDSTAPSMLVTEKLPNASRYATMLEGVRDAESLREEPLDSRQPMVLSPMATDSSYLTPPEPTPVHDDDVTTVTFEPEQAPPAPASTPSISEILAQPITTSLEDTTSTAQLSYRAGGLSDTGKVRRANEDAMLLNSLESLWLVADGMGGHAGGQLASSTVIECINSVSLPPDLHGKVHLISRALHAANRRLLNYAAHHPNHAGLGSTVAVLLANDDQSAIIWVGDTRVYRKRGNVLEQLTSDHSEQQERLARGDIGALLSPRNVITRAVGGGEQLQLATIEQPVIDGDRFVLCSDGVYEAMSHDELAGLLTESDPTSACTNIIARINAGRAEDNATIVIVDAEVQP